MTSVRRVFVVLSCAALLLAADAQCAWACSCAPPDSPADARDQRSAVFAGRVIDVSIPDPNAYTLFLSAAVSVAVEQVWKGDVDSSIVISTSRAEASCGYTFVVGQEYLIYAFEYEGQLVTGICERTRLLADAQADLAVLGEAQVPIAAPIPSTTATPSTTPQPLPADVDTANLPASNVAALVAMGGIGVLVVVFAGIALRRFLPC